LIISFELKKGASAPFLLFGKEGYVYIPHDLFAYFVLHFSVGYCNHNYSHLHFVQKLNGSGYVRVFV
ncbi:hypothetical protein, partial [Kluyvera cryocrescens]|uniref:hypothetical protein n=1 Tax=Kluyvera cryocrescens TaxID=580 RepID=UPI000A4501F8